MPCAKAQSVKVDFCNFLFAFGYNFGLLFFLKQYLAENGLFIVLPIHKYFYMLFTQIHINYARSQLGIWILFSLTFENISLKRLDLFMDFIKILKFYKKAVSLKIINLIDNDHETFFFLKKYSLAKASSSPQ